MIVITIMTRGFEYVRHVTIICGDAGSESDTGPTGWYGSASLVSSPATCTVYHNSERADVWLLTPVKYSCGRHCNS